MLDESGLAFSMSSPVIRKVIGSSSLFKPAVLLSCYRMRSQVIAEENMALDLRVTNLKSMKMVAVEAVSCSNEVPTARDPIFAPRYLLKALELVGAWASRESSSRATRTKSTEYEANHCPFEAEATLLCLCG